MQFLWILLAAAIVLLAASVGGTIYFFRFALMRKGMATQTATQVQRAGTGPVGMNTGTDWSQYFGLIGQRKEWLLKQEIETCWITSRDGLKLHALLLPAAKKTGKTVIAFHGYRSSGLANCTICTFFHALGLNVLMVDNRAHGESEGKYIGFGCLDQEDCMQWINFMIRRDGDDAEILLYGVSMGASTVLMAGGRNDFPAQVKAIVADCGFTSAWDVFGSVLKKEYHLPPFPILYGGSLLSRWFAGYGLRDVSALERVKQAHAPILFIHGENDTFVPPEMSQKNYEACVSEKKLVTIPKAGHGSAYYAGTQRYEQEVSDWVRRFLGQC